MQAKRIQIADGDINVNGQLAVSIVVPSTERMMVNAHNIWASFSAEVEDAGANAQGTWILMMRPVNRSIPNITDAVINAETDNVNFIACGVWGASNESTFNKEIHTSTSRNMNPGDAMDLIVHATGVTVGQVSLRISLCFHTTRK